MIPFSQLSDYCLGANAASWIGAIKVTFGTYQSSKYKYLENQSYDFFFFTTRNGGDCETKVACLGT